MHFTLLPTLTNGILRWSQGPHRPPALAGSPHPPPIPVCIFWPSVVPFCCGPEPRSWQLPLPFPLPCCSFSSALCRTDTQHRLSFSAQHNDLTHIHGGMITTVRFIPIHPIDVKTLMGAVSYLVWPGKPDNQDCSLLSGILLHRPSPRRARVLLLWFIL